MLTQKNVPPFSVTRRHMTSRLVGALAIAATFLGWVADLPRPAIPSSHGSHLVAATLRVGERKIPTGTDALQLPLLAWTKTIQNTVKRENLQGFAGVRLDTAQGTVILYWQGLLPDSVVAAVNGAASDVHVLVQPVQHSLTEFDREEKRILQSVGRVVSVAPNADFSGINVAYDDQIGAGPPAIPSTFPISFVPRTATMKESRDGDFPPFFGGAQIQTPDTGCSTGFSDVDNPTQAIRGITTAGHCGHGLTWKTPTGAYTVGTSGSCCSGTDVMNITGGQNYGPSIYTGGPSSNSYAPVDSVADPVVGETVCFGGGYSGEVCGGHVDSVNQYQNVDTVGLVGPGFWATQPSHVALAGTGDSGGPVYFYDGAGGAVALGSIDGYDTTSVVTCQGAQTALGAPRQCGYHNFAVQIAAAMSALNVHALIEPNQGIIKSTANNLFASTELGYGGGYQNMLRARASAVGPWERYFIVPQSGGVYAIISDANNLYVSTELGYGGGDYAMLRARASVVGPWEQYRLISLDGYNTYAIQSVANNLYVSAELGYGAPLTGEMRARASAIGAWEQFSIQ